MNGNHCKNILADDPELTGTDFIRSVVKLILDESKIVGNGQHIKQNHPRLVDFKSPAEIEQLFDYQIGAAPESTTTLVEFCRKTIAHSLKTAHPNYLNSLFGGVDQFGLTGSWLTEALNGSMATWELSPVFSIMERHLFTTMGKLAGFHRATGLFSPGGSMANGYAMLLARHRLLPDLKRHGLVGQTKRLVMFVSDQAHYSFRKMSLMLGHGTDSVIAVATDRWGRMLPDQLDAAIVAAKADGTLPFMVAATVGTTVFGAFDQLTEIAAVCGRHKLWLHVDGALGGTWLLSRTHRHLLAGLECADSLTWDFHKMLAVPVYCSMILVNNRSQQQQQPQQTSAADLETEDLFTAAFSLNAAYLFQADKYYDRCYDAGDRSVQCIRKIESFKLWLFLKAHGRDRLATVVDNAFEMARYFEQLVAGRANFRLLFDRSESNNVCFHFIPDKYVSNFAELTADQHQRICTELKRRMMTTGSMLIAYQTISEKGIPACFRLTVPAMPVRTETDIDQLVERIEQLGKDIVV